MSRAHARARLKETSKMNQLPQIHHEKLEVYQKAIKFLILVTSINKEVPRGNSEFKDQLKRASLSIVLNIAEGYGKYHNRDKVRFYQIAKGSAHECAAVLDCLKVVGFIEGKNYQKGKKLIYDVVCMLVRLCQ